MAGLAFYAALAYGFVPHRFNPLKPIDLDRPDAWFLDARLARLRDDPAACRALIQSPVIAARPIADAPLREGCGWSNAVSATRFGGARLGIDAISCEMAAALAMWVQHVVQPAADAHFQSRVAAVQNFGGYTCRNIIGNKFLSQVRSQHATANALDVSAFTLETGRRIIVKSHWTSEGPEGRFLRDVHRGACRFFRVVLGPNFNAAHHDHFHFDRGAFRSCK